MAIVVATCFWWKTYLCARPMCKWEPLSRLCTRGLTRRNHPKWADLYHREDSLWNQEDPRWASRLIFKNKNDERLVFLVKMTFFLLDSLCVCVCFPTQDCLSFVASRLSDHVLHKSHSFPTTSDILASDSTLSLHKSCLASGKCM